ncbi:MAG TPA: alpha-1,4-glucan--maltose-1-phosphate maltosyltransferase [Terriglobia bacterium]|nr:alpha-1,4-glucan--maltose-1-phosphate maltosyltransferase [Terriglobia bacterium]
MTSGLEENSHPTRSRVVIERMAPEIDGGRFPIKRVEGDEVVVTADIFADGHDLLTAVLRYRRQGEAPWREVPMQEVGNDRWCGRFTVGAPGLYEYTLQAWVDHFKSWRRDLAKRIESGQDVSADLLIGAQLVEEGCRRAGGADAMALEAGAGKIRALARAQSDAGDGAAAGSNAAASRAEEARRVLDEEVAPLLGKHPDRRFAAVSKNPLVVSVDRTQARFSAWYEMFPRSAAAEAGRHGTLRDCEERLGYVAGMGFDVLYLPPIHPIGRIHRKGKNNNPVAGPEDVGSPWAVGAAEGGHKTIHPQLGSLEDFRRLLAKCRDYGLEIALDLAYQCAPDHPYVSAHPEWFRHRPDGSVQYAENPPKKYEDIYPFDFDTDAWRELWEELRSVALFWIDEGVRIFRVDNPHTKPFQFWEWLIGGIKAAYPDVLFLAEAFTRPKVMYGLAKLGFTHSYTYFAWRNTKWELTQYFTELAQTPVREFFRPHLWPNTPDILTETLQYGGRPAFMARLVLAATLGANYGIYGPAFELCENRALEPGREEYLDAEKYQLRHRDLSAADSLRDFITRVNICRRQSAALQSDANLRFHNVDNEQLMAFTKATDSLSEVDLVVVNLDSNYTQSGWVQLPLGELGLDEQQPYQAHDLLTDARYLWNGARNFVELNPRVCPAHIFRLRRRVRTERDFDTFL